MKSKLYYTTNLVQLVFFKYIYEMKSILIYSWILLFPLFSFGQILGQHNDISSYIEIEGQSNINSFELKASWDQPTKYASYKNSDKLYLKVPFSNFKTKKKVIYKNFLDMVKYQEHPDLKISFSTQNIKNPLVNTIECDITLSGVTKHYSIPVYCFQVGDNSFYIKGSNTINLNSFQLEPPTKLFKLIKIKDHVEVNFALLVTDDELELNSIGF